MSLDNKKEFLIGMNLIREEDTYDESDVDSTDTPIQPPNRLVMKAAGRIWGRISEESKNAWKERAERLNSLPPRSGRFESIPYVLEQNNLRSSVMDSLSVDWKNTASLFHRSILVNKKKITVNSYMSYKFGNERIILYTQSYRSFHMNHLLKLTIFGNPLFCNLLPYEVPYRWKNQSVIHIFSHRRLSELLTFVGLDATEIYKDGLKYVACGKANLRRGRRNIIGHVMDENGDKLLIKVEGANNYIQVKRPEYDSDNGEFLYNNPQQEQALSPYSLTQLWPVRMKITSSGQISYIISVHTYKGDSNEVEETLI